MDSDLDADQRGRPQHSALDYELGLDQQQSHQHQHRARDPHQLHEYPLEPSEPPYHHQQQHHNHQHHLTTQQSSPTHHSSDPQFDHHAVATNGRHHEFQAVNPDDFYKSYRGLQYEAPPDSLPMAPSSIPRPTLRSNGDGTTPRYPVVPPNRGLPRPNNIRAASNPVDNRVPAPGASSASSGKPSVKDLKKRFDQNGDTISGGRPPARSTAAATRMKRDGFGSSPSSRETAPSYAAARSGVESPSSHDSRSARLQRPKYVAEDQVSSNARSFASRVGKPRSQSGANPNPPHSAAELSSQVSPQPPSAALPPSHPPQGLLFGEILPEQCDTSALGFGIDSVRPRGASDSEGSWTHQRSLSAPKADPPQENWHQDEVDTAPAGDESQADARVISNGRGRSLSEVASGKLQSPRDPTGAARSSAATSRTQTPTASRLPVSSRKLSTPVDSSSPDTTRPNSPTTLKRQPANGRGSRATTPTSRARTPTSRAKTPTRTAGRQKEAAPALPTPDSNSRLQAYIGNPPPKLSPPLRSSRPRQPVSMATTASSRMKAVDRSKPPVSSRSRNSSRAPDPETRRRKISVGPIDFEQRREHIRLAYSKSLRESQALEARKRAAERRRLELEAQAEAEAKARAAEAGTDIEAEPNTTGPPTSALPTTSEDPEDALEPSTAEQQHTVHDALNIIVPVDPHHELARSMSKEPEAPSPTLTPTTSQQTELPPPSLQHGSPTLGLPGSFPAFSPPLDNDEAPPSAVSAVSTATETTEFDNEVQENSPIPAESPIDAPITVVKPPSPRAVTPVQQKVEYQYPFEDEPDTPEKLPAIQPQAQTSREPAATDYDGFPVIPGAFGDDHEAEDVVPTPVDPRYESPATLSPQAYEYRAADSHAESIPFPRIHMADESDCHSEYDGDVRDSVHHAAYGHDDAATDACTEDTDDHGRTDDCRSESHFSDQGCSNRASSCASVDADIGIDNDHHHARGEVTSVPNDLLMPPSLSKRLSHHSQWTDYTVGSPDPSVPTASPNMNQEEESPTFGHVTIFGSNVITRDPEPIHREQGHGRPSVDSQESSGFVDHEQLPQVDMGEDFNISYLPQDNAGSSPYIPSPNYRPPPIPTSVSGSVSASRRTSSGFYEQSQYGSTMMTSGRGSEEVLSQLETPQTIDSTSLGTSDQYFGAPSQDSEAKALEPTDDELTEKERRRLVQRRNVIKELVDTEAVFVRDMNIVEEIYKGTAEACPKLDSKTIKQIFRNSEEIIAFHTIFLGQIKEAVSGVYVMRSDRTADRDQGKPEISDASDREVSIGPVFKRNIEKMKTAHEGFLRSSDQAAKKLIQIQQDPTVKVWLNECNEVAKELTAAWDLDSLLIKPMQRITKYPNLIITLLQHTPQDHPDREELAVAKDILETAIIEINKTKKNFELVGQIVGRKRKESDVKGGFARAFGKRVDKLQTTGNRPPEDPEYAKLNEKFGDDYLRLQVVLRDVEFYTRQVSTHVREFLQYLSSVELIMRLQPGSYPELESKWVQFNISIRDIEKVALEEHLAQVRKQVIEPFEHVIKAYGNPSLAMKKRAKRRLDYERMEQLKRGGKSVDPRLQELVEHYEALNDTLKKELPQLSALTEKVGNICLGNFVQIQAKWYGIWKDKMKTVLADGPEIPDLEEVVSTFQRDFPFMDEQVSSIGILNPVSQSRPSQSTAYSGDDALSKKTRSPRPSDVDTMRSRGLSINADLAPSIPTPDFLRYNHGSTLSMSPTSAKHPNVPSPHQYYYRDYYAGINPHATNSSSSATPEMTGSSRSQAGTGATSTRPSTGRSFESGGVPRQSLDSTSQYRRDSYSTYNSNHPQHDNRRFSGIFHSALPMPEGPEESRRSSRASSRERRPSNDGYNVLWLAASLFEFNIATTKHEAGYPYLIYQAGEIFDVIAEKGELWLAKNQDDPAEQVGWIWSKHFAKLADS